jgi:hypothetical protein
MSSGPIKPHRKVIKLTLLSVTILSAPAWAQATDHDAIDEAHMREHDLRLMQQSPRALIDNVVVQRLRPLYDAAGIDVASFRFYPKMDAQLVYDDNIFEAPRKEADEFLIFGPSLSVRSQWHRHSLGLEAGASAQRFARHPSENLENYNVAVNGILDFGLGGHLSGVGRIAKENEARGTLGDVFPGGEPIQFQHNQLTGRIEENWVGVYARLEGEVGRFRYDDVRYQGVTYSQRYRDRDDARVAGELALKIGGGLAFFTEFTANKVRYLDRQAPFSSHGESVLAGLTFQVPTLLSGEIGIGYLRQTYDTLPLRPVDGPTYNVVLIWNPTTLFTVTVNAHRSIQQTPFVQAPSIIENRFDIVFDYELLPNVLFNLRANVILDDFGRTYRVDKRYEGILTGQYLINRFLRVSASIERRNQQAGSSFLRPYHGTALRIGLTAQR